MSACISSLGEYSDHIVRDDFVCERCYVFDEVGLIDALNAAKAKLTKIRELATEWAKAHDPAKPSEWLYGFDEGGRTAGEWLLEILDGDR